MTGSKDNLRPLDSALPFALLRARETVMTQFRPFLARRGCTEQQWRVLRVLYEAGELDPTEIANRSVILTPSMTRILKTLEERGMVIRKPHPTDRRRFLVQMTQDARLLVEESIPDSNAAYAEIERLFGKDKLKRLLTLLNEFSEKAPK